MKQYIYRGETERNFYLAFTQAVGTENVTYSDTNTDDKPIEKPYGVIIVPKDFENKWIGSLHYYLGWKILITVAHKNLVTGFNEPHWIIIEEGTLMLGDVHYVIFQRPDNSIAGDTYCGGITKLADSLDEFKKIPRKDWDRILYSIEMSVSR